MYHFWKVTNNGKSVYGSVNLVVLLINTTQHFDYLVNAKKIVLTAGTKNKTYREVL